MKKCPICKNDVVEDIKENKNFPFCSLYCKRIDLYNWINEEYRISTDDETCDEYWEN